MSEFAQKFFVSQLSTREGAACGGEYFKSRGIEPETIAKFGLGWAPAAKSSLVDAALAAGYKAEYLLDAGVAVQREDGSLADKFRERVMFPIHSVSGRVIAFSGRRLRSDNPAKYVNSPETEIYVKSRNLLGIYFAKSEISRLDKCILVEGNIDMVMMHQLGIRNVVASCGTSLTVEQIRLIHKFTDNISIMYDGDSAGVHAAIRGLSMILSEGMNVKVVLLPENEDPDSFSRKHTLREVQAYIEEGEKDFITFKTDLLLEQAEGDPLKKAELINDIADTIAVIPDPVKRSTYVDETARRFGVESAILFQRISGVRRSGAAGMQAQSRTEPEEPAPVQEWTEENRLLAPSEKDLLSFLLTHGCDELDFPSDSEYYGGDEDFKPSVADFIRDALEADGTKMANSAYAAVYDAYMALYDEGLAQDDIVKRLLDSPDRTVASVAAQLSTHKYMITVKAFENALTTVPSWLAAQVPRAIMCYADCRISDRLEQLRRTLSEELSPEVQTASMQEMVKLQAARKRIRKMIGREKNTV